METVRGWVWNVRDLGGVKFVLIRVLPNNRVEQVVVKRGNVSDEEFEAVSSFYPETLIEVHGEWRKTDKYRTGREFVAKKIVVIANSKPLPIDLTGKTPTDFSVRVKYRYLDIRKPKVSAIFRAKAEIIDAVREFLKKEGFVELQFPIIIATATEGGAELFPVVYFEREAFLAQSSQLYKQSAVPAFGKVFAIAPSFRAEKSRTRKHLTEFWEFDVEAAFVDREDIMEIEYGMYKSAVQRVLKECEEELELLGHQPVVPKKYEKIGYDEALEILRTHGVELPWGEDFGASEERVLCSHFPEETPFFITEFPEKIVGFYYKQDPNDPRYAWRMDFMAPGPRGLELSSGGPRENDPESLRKRLEARGLNPESFGWYIEMFEYGFPPHGGFGMGIERLTMYILGLEKVMEAALYPRTPDILAP